MNLLQGSNGSRATASTKEHTHTHTHTHIRVAQVLDAIHVTIRPEYLHERFDGSVGRRAKISELSDI